MLIQSVLENLSVSTGIWGLGLLLSGLVGFTRLHSNNRQVTLTTADHHIHPL